MAINMPDNIKCTDMGKDPRASDCACWDSDGNAQPGTDCHSPAACLIYDTDTEGGFQYAALAPGDSINDLLGKWSVPDQLKNAFVANAGATTSGFPPFKYVVADGHAGTAATYVGVARTFNNTRQLGYAWGTEDTSVVQPYTCPSGGSGAGRRLLGPSPHPGPGKPADKRDLTDDEIQRIEAGMEGYAWKKAAGKAYPQAAAAFA